MDATIRNIDPAAWRALKARAALRGQTIGEAFNEAIRAYLGRPAPAVRRCSLLALTPEPYPEGNERLSEEIDRVAYGS